MHEPVRATHSFFLFYGIRHSDSQHQLVSTVTKPHGDLDSLEKEKRITLASERHREQNVYVWEGKE